MPGWTQAVGRQLDDLIAQTVPNVRRAVKWNTPFYGVEPGHWFTAFHCFDRYVKLTFFRGQSLDPVPPVASKSGDTRYVHIHEGDDFPTAKLAAWFDQASKLPGEKL